YHPSIVPLGANEHLATFDLGQTVEAMDYHTVAARSTGGGEHWQLEGPLLAETPPSPTHSIRTSRFKDGSLVGFGGFYHPLHPPTRVGNPQTFRFLPA